VFKTRGPAAAKTPLPTVESLTGSNSRLLELADPDKDFMTFGLKFVLFQE